MAQSLSDSVKGDNIPLSPSRLFSPFIHSSPCNTWTNHTAVAMEDRGEASDWLWDRGCLVQSLLELTSWEAEPQLTSLLAEHSAAQTASESCKGEALWVPRICLTHTHTTYMHIHTLTGWVWERMTWRKKQQQTLKTNRLWCSWEGSARQNTNYRHQHDVWTCAEILMSDYVRAK